MVMGRGGPWLACTKAYVKQCMMQSPGAVRHVCASELAMTHTAASVLGSCCCRPLNDKRKQSPLEGFPHTYVHGSQAPIILPQLFSQCMH